MQLLTFKAEGRLHLGVKTPAGVVDVATAQAALGVPARTLRAPETLDELLAGGDASMHALVALARRTAGLGEGHSWLLDEAGLTYAPCVPHPGKIFLVGRNYREHAAETGHQVTETPTLFSKFGNAPAGHHEEVPLPKAATNYDYEAELCAVIGRRAHHVSEADALSCVLGYCNANDLSARDLQFKTSQWLLGKTLDKFLPLGPCLVTADELPDPQALSVRCWMNGKMRQDGHTSDMVFTVAALIAYIAQYMPLEPGDIICTGTPAGVIEGRQDKVWLKPGDEVTVEVEGLGRLTNKLAAEP